MKQPTGDKTAKQMWGKYKKELISGNPTQKTLIDIKNNLSKDHWETFADLAAQNLSKESRYNLTHGLIKLEDPHSPNNYLLRSNSLARMFFMYDNPEIDKTRIDQFNAYDAGWVKGTSDFITDDHIKLLIAGGVGEKDIASVTFFNTVNASITEHIMKKMQSGLPDEEKRILLGVLGVMKGEAKITRPHEEIFRENMEKLREKARETLKEPELGEKLKSIDKAQDTGLKFLEQLKGQIALEQENIVERFKQINSAKMEVNTNVTPQQQTISKPTSVVMQTHTEIFDKHIDSLITKLDDLYKNVAKPISTIDNAEFQKNMKAAKDTLTLLQEKAELDKKNNLISSSQYSEINKKLQAVNNIHELVEHNHKALTIKYNETYEQKINKLVDKLDELYKKLESNDSSTKGRSFQKDINTVKNDLEKLQVQTGKDRALSQSDRKEFNTKLTAALHLQGVVQTSYKTQQKELDKSSYKFEQFVSSFKNKFSKKQEKPLIPAPEIKPKTPSPMETRSEPDRRAGRRFS